MTVKILLERKFKEEPSLEEIKIINELRMGAMLRKGYVSGETLVDLNDHRRIVVISVWANKEDWKEWESSDHRRKLEANLNETLKKSAVVRTFMLGADYLGAVFEEVVHESEAGS
ncbi:MAG: sugar biosynthesis protein [Desulfobacteraceae bacterium]|nr:sugar biosynthesis protein [Desulfobacteraceae bacterium]